MVRITALSKVTLSDTDIRYTIEWKNAKRYGTIDGVSEHDAQTLLENNNHQLQVQQDDNAGKVEKYLFDQNGQSFDNEDIKEADFVILKDVGSIDYNNIAMTVTELVKDDKGQITHVKCAWNDFLPDDDYTVKTVKTGTFPISAVAKHKNIARKYINAI